MTTSLPKYEIRPPGQSPLPPPFGPKPFMVGWRCPVCGRGNSPYTATCSCVVLPVTSGTVQ